AMSGLAFGPDGRFLAAWSNHAVFVWDSQSDHTPIQLPHLPVGCSFSPDGRQVAICTDGKVHVFELPSGQERLAFSMGFGSCPIAFSPDGRLLAGDSPWNSSAVRIYDVQTGRLYRELTLPQTNTASAPSWHADGERLAVGGVNGRVYLFHIPDRRLLGVLEGHAQDVTEAVFTGDGDHLLSHSWDGTFRLWEVATGRQLLSRPGHIEIDIHPGSARLGFVIDRNRGVQFYDLVDGGEYRTLVSDLGPAQGAYRSVEFGSDGRLVAAAMDDGVRLWELPSGREAALLQVLQCNSLAFTPDGRALLTCGPGAGFQRWPLDPDPADPNGLVIGRPRTLNLPVAPGGFRLTPDGSVAVLAGGQPRSVVLFDMASEQPRPFLMDHPSVSSVSIAADGRWAASSGWHSAVQRVWDAHTGRMVKEFHLGDTTAAFCSPDGRWIITSTPDEYCFWDVETWQAGWRIPREQEPYPGLLAFTQDGRIMAVELKPGVFGLLDWQTGRILARLEDPTHDRSSYLSFSPDGCVLATNNGYDKAVHLWDLRRIRERLAAMGLAGDWPAYPPAPPSPPPLHLRMEDGSPAAGPLPVVALTPKQPVHRAATPQQIQDWIGRLGGDDAKASTEAAAALVDVGPPAVDALKKTASGADGKLSRRAGEVLDQIAVAEALAPTRIHLKLRNASVADAVAALAGQSAARVEYSATAEPGDAPKNITLELDNVPFWEAIDRLCEAGDLSFGFAPGRGLRLSDGPRAHKEIFADAGPFRVQAGQWLFNRTVTLSGKEPATTEFLNLNLMLLGDPSAAVVNLEVPSLLEAEDDGGQSRLIDRAQGAPPGYPSGIGDPGAVLFGQLRTLQLKPSERRGGVLKRLKGVLPVEVMTDRRDLATAADVGKAQGKTFAGVGGQLRVHSVQVFANGSPGQQAAMILFSMDGGPDWSYNAAAMSFELTDAAGLRIRPTWVNPSMGGPVRRRPGPAELAAFSAAPAAGWPAALPWAGLALNPSPAEHGWTGNLQFMVPDNIDLSTCKLTVYRYRRVRTELPFEFHDLPLP
ncbi:MAG TPA: hypothetical protein VMS17_08055, partial [Gemmataceae bacterium]|nr:hypothetical protein [Gemmataceae bacterium]